MTLEDAKKDFKALFKNSRDALFIADGEGRLVEVNQAALDMFEFTRKEIIGMNVRDFYYAEIPDDPLWRELQKKGQVKDYEKALKRRDGSRIYALLSVRLRKEPRGGIAAIQGIIHDITSLKDAQDTLEKERNFISSMLETTRALIVLLDPQGRFIRLNPAFEKMMGRGIMDLVGQPFTQALADGSDKEKFSRLLSRIVGGKRPVERRLELLTADGNRHPVLWSLDTMGPDKDSPDYIILSGMDLTELERSRDQVKILRGLLPICAGCKKIRDDGGYWNQIEHYIQQHSEADFSHGLCPDCMQRLYPDYNNGK